MAKTVAELKADAEAAAKALAEAEAAAAAADAAAAEPKTLEERVAALEAVSFSVTQSAKLKEILAQHHGVTA